MTGLSVFARAATQPVPSACTPMVNQTLAQFVASHQGAGQEADQDNVMVCGTMLRNSLTQHAGHSGHGAHEVLILSVPTANGSLQIEVVTNDQLDGVVTGNKGDAVFAYGQAYVDAKPIRAGGFTVAGGVHEPHCATHAGADDGWVVVAGKRYPAGTCSDAQSRTATHRRRR